MSLIALEFALVYIAVGRGQLSHTAALALNELSLIAAAIAESHFTRTVLCTFHVLAFEGRSTGVGLLA